MRRAVPPRRLWIVACVTALVAVTTAAALRTRSSRGDAAAVAAAPVEADTSRDALEGTITRMQARLERRPDDAAAAVALAQALVRKSRLTGDGGLVRRADRALQAVLEHDPSNYLAEQTRAVLLLSAHRFAQAVEVAERCRRARPLDPVNFGIIGDGHLELGHYELAFEAFDRMMQLRPSAAAYARVAYARELQGDLYGALSAMSLAADAVPPADLESQAWHRAQIGELLLKLGRVADARAAFMRASAAFPGHPFAVIGYARTLRAEGDVAGAVDALTRGADGTSSPDVHILLGEMLAQQGDAAAAREHVRRAEVALRSDWSEPRHLAVFLANHGRPDEAVSIAEQAARSRDDIFTCDALAWAYFKAGRLADASDAIARALRTGTRDPDILAHADAIRAALRQPAVAS